MHVITLRKINVAIDFTLNLFCSNCRFHIELDFEFESHTVSVLERGFNVKIYKIIRLKLQHYCANGN